MYKTQAMAIQGIQRLMDSDNVMKEKSGEMFLAFRLIRDYYGSDIKCL